MIAPLRIVPCPHAHRAQGITWHAHFLNLLPAIRRHAQVSFRHLNQDAREEAVQEVISNALQAFVGLWEQGRCDLAYATPLARFGVCRFREGRHFGGHSDVRDLLSVHRKRRSGVRIERLHEFDELADQWKEIVVEDGKSLPADIAALRIDFANWLDTLCGRDRRVAEMLAQGERTGTVAQMFSISAGRVAQLRKELCDHWHRFQGESTPRASRALER